MKYTKEFEELGLPRNFKFEIELEAYNVKTKGKNSLYTGKSAKYIKQRNWHMATKNEEILVGKGGAELVSPILQDTKKDWESISDICKQMKNFMQLYVESEEILYKMCNDKNDPIRKGAINKNFKGIHLISAMWRNGMAAPSGKKILEYLNNVR